MPADNIVLATNSMRSSVSSLKRKLSNLRIQLEVFDTEIEKIETKFEKILSEAEIYKAKVEREMGREVRRLELEIKNLQSNSKIYKNPAEVAPEEIKIAQTICIFDSILRNMCQGADDFRTISEAFLFPAVYERVVKGTDDAYFLEEMPHTASLILQRGREYLNWVRSECDTHLTEPSAWEGYVGIITDWWRNDALPLIYGSRDEQWDIDAPLSLPEMMSWQNNPGDRPLNFSPIFDAYEIYRNHKDTVYESTGTKQFDVRAFSFTANA